MPPQPSRGGPRQRILPTPRGVNMIIWSLDNRFVLAAIMGDLFISPFHVYIISSVLIPMHNINLLVWMVYELELSRFVLVKAINSVM